MVTVLQSVAYCTVILRRGALLTVQYALHKRRMQSYCTLQISPSKHVPPPKYTEPLRLFRVNPPYPPLLPITFIAAA